MMTTFMETKNNQIAIFDSSGLISLLIKTDSNHLQALGILQHAHKKGLDLILPLDVFSETVNLIGEKFGHQQAAQIGELLLSNPKFLLTGADSSYKNPLILLKKTSVSVSFTDCVVMSLADANHTVLVFGFDKIFKQQGYSLPQ